MFEVNINYFAPLLKIAKNTHRKLYITKSNNKNLYECTKQSMQWDINSELLYKKQKSRY